MKPAIQNIQWDVRTSVRRIIQEDQSPMYWGGPYEGVYIPVLDVVLREVSDQIAAQLRKGYVRI